MFSFLKHLCCGCTPFNNWDSQQFSNNSSSSSQQQQLHYQRQSLLHNNTGSSNSNCSSVGGGSAGSNRSTAAKEDDLDIQMYLLSGGSAMMKNSRESLVDQNFNNFLKGVQPLSQFSPQQFDQQQQNRSNGVVVGSSLSSPPPPIALIISYENLEMNIDDLDAVGELMKFVKERQVSLYVFHLKCRSRDEMIMVSPKSCETKQINGENIMVSNGICHVMYEEPRRIREFPYDKITERVPSTSTSYSNGRKSVFLLDEITKRKSYAIICQSASSGIEIQCLTSPALDSPNSDSQQRSSNLNYRQLSYSII